MSLLGRLWQKIWDREEMNKQTTYHQAVAGASAEQARHTEIQRIALKYWSYFQSHQAGYQSATSSSLLYNSPTTTLLTNTNALTAQTYTNQLALQNSQLGQAVFGLGSGAATGMLYPGQTTSIFPGQVFQTVPTVAGGHNNLDTFFMTLRGIEEWGKEHADPEIEFVEYDIDALRLSDTRRFDPQKISLLGLASFCLTNVVDLDDILILLEGHGLGVA